MNYIAQTQSDFENLSQAAVNNPDAFWSRYAEENFNWHKKWSTVSNCDLTQGKISWFEGAQLNITENCLDRHAANQPNKTALIWEPNESKEPAIEYSYQELLDQVSKTANMLKEMGVQKGDRICMYLPMVPELAFSVLACARIGAIHSVVFAGFSAQSLADRINDASCKWVITADGGFRGNKITPLKKIADEALAQCDCVEKVLVVQRTQSDIEWNASRDIWWHDQFEKQTTDCPAEIMDAEDKLFILYTSGSTGKPKGMVHSSAGYMVYTTYSFLNVFQCRRDDVYWCTADIGWITGHSYILYGPLSAGATTLMFEGTPSYPDMGKFWEIVEKHKVNIFYTAPTAIRSLATCDLALVNQYDLSSLRVLGTVGEPINEEAWRWYDEHIGKGNCPIVDTWWQTETGGIMISNLAGVTPAIPTMATLPLPGVQLALMDTHNTEINEMEAEGALCIKAAWPGMARTIYGNHQRFVETYYSTYPGYYFTGDGARRDAQGNYRITGRMDDVVIVSGHNLGTAEIEDCIDELPQVIEAAVVGYPHAIKGNAICAYLCAEDLTEKEVKQFVSDRLGPISKPEQVVFVTALPKTRSGKIMRRILRKIAAGETDALGDISTLLNPDCVKDIIQIMA
jgi:acetyl-CoA synthetase